MPHECDDSCPMHNVFLPNEVVINVERVAADILVPIESVEELKADFPDTPVPAIPVVTVSMVGTKHQHEWRSPPDEEGLTIGLVHEEVDLFVHTLLSALERNRPGYIGKVIGEVFAAVHAAYYDEAEAFRVRMLGAIDGWAVRNNIPLSDLGLEEL
mgnify:CR=1 FL=1